MATRPPLRTSEPDPLRVWQLLRLHRPALALQMSEQLLARDPTNLSTLLARTEALRRLDRLPEAAVAAKTAIAQSPESPGAHYMWAQVLGQQGALKEAELAVLDAIRLNPTDADYFGFLAQLRYLLRRPAEALASANSGLALDARNIDCLLWRALSQEQRDRPEAADEDFRQLLRVAPANNLVHSRLGQVLLRRGEPRAAAPHLAEALRQAPEEAPKLVPLLRQARLQATWPDWLLRSIRREVSERGLGIDPGFKAFGLRLAMLFFTYRAEWLTRYEPIPGRPPLVRPWASTPLAWAVFGVLLVALIYLNATQHLRAGPTIFMLTIFALRFMLKRQEQATGFPDF